MAVFLTDSFAQAQAEFMTQTTRDRINFSNLNVSNNNTLFAIKGPAGVVLGTPYLDRPGRRVTSSSSTGWVRP